MVQADEVDVLTGAGRLAVMAKKLFPEIGDQNVYYLMSCKSVQQPERAFHLLETVMTMANYPHSLGQPCLCLS